MVNPVLLAVALITILRSLIGDDDSNYNIMVVFFVISVTAIVFC